MPPRKCRKKVRKREEITYLQKIRVFTEKTYINSQKTKFHIRVMDIRMKLLQVSTGVHGGDTGDNERCRPQSFS